MQFIFIDKIFSHFSAKKYKTWENILIIYLRYQHQTMFQYFSLNLLKKPLDENKITNSRLMISKLRNEAYTTNLLTNHFEISYELQFLVIIRPRFAIYFQIQRLYPKSFNGSKLLSSIEFNFGKLLNAAWVLWHELESNNCAKTVKIFKSRSSKEWLFEFSIKMRVLGYTKVVYFVVIKNSHMRAPALLKTEV